MSKRKRHASSTNKSSESSLFRVKPRNKPEVIDYYMTSSDVKNWTKHPGSIMAMISGFKAEDLDKEIIAIIDPLSNLSREKHNERLLQKLVDCRHKLHAVKYHLQTLEKEIVERVKEFEKKYNAGAGIPQELKNPRLIYET